jgi:hypothetical protein
MSRNGAVRHWHLYVGVPYEERTDLVNCGAKIGIERDPTTEDRPI